ncbi:MAG TPA: hypothetical protein VEK81_08325 [Burkholderiales bacterium]|nr:hypothetical protein [Burkholderiales bacterium]
MGLKAFLSLLFFSETGLPSVANREHTSDAGFVIASEGVVVFDTLGKGRPRRR